MPVYALIFLNRCNSIRHTCEMTEMKAISRPFFSTQRITIFKPFARHTPVFKGNLISLPHSDYFITNRRVFDPVYACEDDYERSIEERQDDPPSLKLHRRAIERELDPDLYVVLSLASDDELEQLYLGLYDTSLLSPLGKSVQSPSRFAPSNREGLIRRIDRRFRFLAADAESVVRDSYPSYRETLISIHSHLRVPHPLSPSLAVADLEADIFLFLLKEHADAVDAASSPSYAQAASHAQHGDGQAAAEAQSSHTSTRSKTASPSSFLGRFFAPLKLGAKEILPTLTRITATLAFTNANMTISNQLGRAMVQRTIQYEVAARAANKIATHAAQRSLTAAASRYAAARSLLSVVGPVLWAVTALDVARMTIGRDYARIVKFVFTVAQIRLLRTDGWVTKSQYDL